MHKHHHQDNILTVLAVKLEDLHESHWRSSGRSLKQEDSRRKPNCEKYETVSAEEADKITGLDKHKELEKKAAERQRGGRSILGMLMMT